MKRFKRMVGLVLTVCCICAFSIAPAFAASSGTYTKKFSVLNYRIPGFSYIIGCYDNFTVKYNSSTGKITSVDAKQTIKSFLGITTFKKGGIKLISSSKDGKTRIYESKWTRSTPGITIAKLKIKLKLGSGTYRYTVTAKGIKQTKVTSCSVICEN